MVRDEGDRPAAPPRPTNPPDGPPKRRMYSDLPAANRLRVVEIWRRPFQEALAEMAAERATEHARAA